MLASALLEAGCAVLATVTRDEAKAHLFSSLQEQTRFIVARQGFDEPGLVAFLEHGEADVVLDATHPFAVRITQLADRACRRTGVPYVRYERSGVALPAGAVVVDGFAEAAEALPTLGNCAMLTIGAKQLKHFTPLHEKVTMYARVLPSPTSVQQALDAGFAQQRIFGLRPPFSRAFNRALFEHCGAEVLVTKDSGAPGGVEEKVQAADDLGMKVLMIRRPVARAGAVSSVEAAVAACLKAVKAG